MTDRPVTLRGDNRAELVVTCEHASPLVPDRLGDLGLTEAQRSDHIGWDIGAAWVTRALSDRLAAPAVLSSVSRLVVDCNRDPADHDWIPSITHGVIIPSNRDLDEAERARRSREYYDPYHAEIDRLLELSESAVLLSVHSFTPDYDGRDFDIGVLFDDCEAHAVRLAGDLAGSQFAVRMNEPYSGLDGLIFSARSHGRRFQRAYLEIEINNRLLRSEDEARAVAAGISGAVARFVASR